MFESLNNIGAKLNYFVGNSPDEILAQIKQITLPVQIISMYAIGARHIVWFVTDAKIKKITKKGE